MRFAGTVEEIGPVEVSGISTWLAAIPFEEWPQQHPAPGVPVRPAMVTDPNWFGFWPYAQDIIQRLGVWQGEAYWPALSCVMPGDHIPPHRDEQPPDWLYRVHVPILTNWRSVFACGGVEHLLLEGIAYKVNTMAEHAIYNRGSTPRVHFMFDVRA